MTGTAGTASLQQSADVAAIVDFLQLTPAELAAVQALGARLEGRLAALTRAFYRRVTGVAKLRAIIETHSSIEALEQTFYQYLVELFRARVDPAYIERRRAIGRAHVRVSLSPAWYLAAYGVLWEERSSGRCACMATKAAGGGRACWRSGHGKWTPRS